MLQHTVTLIIKQNPLPIDTEQAVDNPLDEHSFLSRTLLYLKLESFVIRNIMLISRNHGISFRSRYSITECKLTLDPFRFAESKSKRTLQEFSNPAELKPLSLIGCHNLLLNKPANSLLGCKFHGFSIK
ncbi:hypothetical protein D3C72_1060890 [compost metagenome]